MDQTPPAFTFNHSSRKVIQAWDGVEKLSDLARDSGAQRAAAIFDGFFKGSALAEKVSDLLAKATGAKPLLHFVPAHEPDTASLEACRDALATVDPDLIVGVGGGSAMDTAKLARMLLANPGPAEAIAGFGKKLKPHRSLLICVPTTAGTGSEVSEYAVASKHGTDSKLLFHSAEMTPQIALLDPALSVSAPKSVTAQSGYDAVTHAVESYVSKAASVMSDPFSRSAMELLGRWLPVAYREPENRAARTWCLVASCQAAIGFNSANLGLAHAISSPLGALHDVGHGLGNALALPVVVAYNEAAMGEKAAIVAQAFGAPTAAGGLSKLRHDLDLDLSLDRFVPTAEAREAVATAAMRSGQVRMNPRLATIDHMRAILEAMRTPTGGQRPPLVIA
jgi:alcohol dehydrogenase